MRGAALPMQRRSIGAAWRRTDAYDAANGVKGHESHTRRDLWRSVRHRCGTVRTGCDRDARCWGNRFRRPSHRLDRADRIRGADMADALVVHSFCGQADGCRQRGEMCHKVTKVTLVAICAGAFSTGAGRFVQGAIRVRGDAETCIGVRRIGVIGPIGCKVRHGRCSGSPYLLRAGGRVPTARRNAPKVTKVTLTDIGIGGGRVRPAGTREALHPPGTAPVRGTGLNDRKERPPPAIATPCRKA